MINKYINIPLFPHQLVSVENMLNLEKNKKVIINKNNFLYTSVGVLADLPGYGKAMSILGLIAETIETPLPEDYFDINRENYCKYIFLSRIEKLQQLSCSLILVNVSLLSQWITELSRTLFRYKIVYNKADIENINFENLDVVVVSQNIYNLFAQVYSKKNWRRFIMDEPPSLKIPSFEKTNASFYWLITATPGEFYMKKSQGMLGELIPDNALVFKNFIIKNDDEFVRSSYNMPGTHSIYYDCMWNIGAVLKGSIPRNVQEMLDAGNIKGVFYFYNQQDNDSLINVVKRHKEGIFDQKQRLWDDEKLKLVEKQLQAIEENIVNYVNTSYCSLCQVELSKTKPFITSCCQTTICQDCCPLEVCKICMTQIPSACYELKTSLSYKDTKKSFEIKKISKNKIFQLMDIVGDGKNKKILIFSNHNETFTILKKFFDDKSLQYLELRGTKDKRDNTLDTYKYGDVNILMLNTIHSGSGLNLQETTDIIIFHKLYDYQECQVIGRANRIGREKELTIHYL